MSVSNKIINKYSALNLPLIVNAALWLVSLTTIVAVFVPFSPRMPGVTLDNSWEVGMNQAVAQGLSLGKKIIFTFGPYASIYTKTYHPSTDFMMVSGSLYLALSYSVCFILLMKGVPWRWVLSICAVFAGLMLYRDPLFFSYPLLVGLTSLKIFCPQDGALAKSKWAPFYIVLLFLPFGLLPLIKGSILILCSAVASLCALFFIANRQTLLAIICLFTPMVSMIFFWIASGQTIANLPSYFISMAPIVSGYTEAMAMDGKLREVLLYLIASGILLLAIAIQTQITKASKIFLFCTYFVFLFLSFKAGFVRHDMHAVISGTAILIGALLLPFVIHSRIVTPVIVFALLAWSIIDSNHIKTSTETVRWNAVSTYSSMLHGIANRINNRNWPRLEFDAAVSSIRKQASLPVLQGTTDIYPSDQSYLIASGNSWNPRPVFQSYSAYTPVLAESNRKHLLGGQAPDNIFFKVAPIDERIPSIEDGASWPVLMVNYRPARMEHNFLFLQKKGNISEIEKPLKLKSEIHAFGESVLLPHSNQPVFAQIDINPTILGRVMSIFFKPSQLKITVELSNGMKKQFRIIAGMAKSGFVISPLIENTAEFSKFYGKEGLLDDKLVKSIAIAPHDEGSRLWKDNYTITFSQIMTGSL